MNGAKKTANMRFRSARSARNSWKKVSRKNAIQPEFLSGQVLGYVAPRRQFENGGMSKWRFFL